MDKRKGKPMKQGILIVSFGTTYRETREKNIEKIAQSVREAFPGRAVYQAYSSNIVRSVLKKRDGIVISNVEEALRQMARDGVTNAAVLPTHVIDGVENSKMQCTIKECSELFSEIRTARALLGNEEDYPLVAGALWQEIGKTAGNDPVVLMGHGSAHEADKSYEELEKQLRARSGKEIYIATVEGTVTIENVIGRMNASVEKRKRVLVLPFMLVAGDHAVNDMAGEKDSFASKLRAEGYKPECVLKGIGEYESIRNIYIHHLREAIG
ncbi:sirohydrochlorin cobaltochelatase [Caproiciproducens faecalis]|uniref:Sirohydrochlorin cobaltochelatase n=1 Tax=Caproiciproducens faecalis TaxID=2820301 RepID=A0ABS7DJ39_9FIRM|nr:sirohydrochlorin cobaltochelatase [Caproiciproducens faecalis]MBW7571293.1 sirohydrochlorin cobaltochelatase [Caproiciproducens faecalis]